MSGLREKIADLVDAISRNEVSEPTDAVLRVLAEHGDTQQVREQIQGIVHAAIFDIAPLATQRRDEIVREVMAVVAPIVAERDAAVERAELDADRLSVKFGWIVERVDQCTCAGGTPESSYAHESSCGYEPIKRIDIGQAINEQVGDLPELLRARLAEMAEGSDEPHSLDQIINEGLMPLVAAHVDWERRVSRRAHDELAAARQQLDHARADGQTAQRDLAAILRALDLGDHARMISSHYVVVEEVLPAIEHMRQQLDQVRALAEQTRLYPDTLRAILDAPARPAGHDETGQ